MRTRLLLFVEGRRDKVMLETWFPLELQSHAIDVILMDGLQSEGSLVPVYESLLSGIGIPFVVLTDKRQRREDGDSGGDRDRLWRAPSTVEDGRSRAAREVIPYEDSLFLIRDDAYRHFA